MSEVHTLKNSLRVFVDPMPSLETVALGVWSHAGSVNEQEAEHGIAHLLEHMAFKGTTTRSARDIAEEIEGVGGYLNAATSHQRTGYYVRLLKDDIVLGLDILSDILLCPTIANEELEKEKEVVVQEIGEAADTPDDVVFEMLQAASWNKHPLARPILGTPDSVRAQTPSSLREFMSRWYHPENMVVAVAGNVDIEDFVRRAGDAFGDMKAREAAEPISAAEFAGGVSHDVRDIEQTHLAIALPGVSVRDEDFFATRVFADVLGGG
ncbi:MAG: insulinase family protein, partial [Marinicaulis sp.]|nr:insulinase family protein [Marinicaulis sp.]